MLIRLKNDIIENMKINIKKLFVIILVNFSIIIAILAIFEYIAYNKVKKNLSLDFAGAKPRYNFAFYDWDTHYPIMEKYNFRKPFGKEYKKSPIVIFGCSYAYGYKLNDEQSLGYKLSEYTKRPVYNRAYNSFGVQHMLYQLEKEDFYKKVPQPEYVIYVYINDHIARSYYHSMDWFFIEYCSYELKKDKLVRWKRFYAPFFSLYSVKELHNDLINAQRLKKPITKFTLKHFVQSKEMIDKHWKGTKFVVVNYDDKNEKELDSLKAQGIEVLHLNHYLPKVNTENKYFLSEQDTHPSEQAWDLIIPVLAQKLNL